MANTYLIDGVEYSKEDIKRFKAGRQTKQRVEIIGKYEIMMEEEREYQKAYRAKNNIDEIQSIWYDEEGNQQKGRPKTLSLEKIDSITVSDFVRNFYRQFWNYDNKGKNALDPNDQLQEVVSRIVYAAERIGVKINDPHKTIELTGEVVKYHAHGNSSIEESIKGVATAYKSQPATRILEGIGNFGEVAGDPGAAGRYTSISGTPLLMSIIRDMQYVDIKEDDEGIKEPEFIPTPIPIGLINGVSSIGSGRSNYIAERPAREVIEWLDCIRKNDWKSETEGLGAHPKPISETGSTAEEDPTNGYIVYGARVHYKVDRDDINKKGNFDVITHLPPKTNAKVVITKLKNHVPKRQKDKIVDGSGDGRPTWIALPTGYLYRDKRDWNKLSLQNARKEFVLMWDKDLVVDGIPGTMVNTDIEHLAERWFNVRCGVVEKRLKHEISLLQTKNHAINLIKVYVENGMNNWKSEDIVEHYVKLAKEDGVLITEDEKVLIKNKEIEKPKPESQGESDASIVLSTAARAFLPENLEANELKLKNNDKAMRVNRKILKNIGDQVIKEAYEVIDEQEKFFKSH